MAIMALSICAQPPAGRFPSYFQVSKAILHLRLLNVEETKETSSVLSVVLIPIFLDLSPLFKAEL